MVTRVAARSFLGGFVEQNPRLSDSSLCILAPTDYFPQDTHTVSHLEQLLAGPLIYVVFLPQISGKCYHNHPHTDMVCGMQ